MGRKTIKKTSSAQKVNKRAKPAPVDPKMRQEAYWVCTCCGHRYRKQEGNFIKSKSPIYKANNGFTSICKECIFDLYEQYVMFFAHEESLAADRICQITDMYFDEDVFKSTRGGERTRNRISYYVSSLNLLQNATNNTYSDTLIKRWDEEQEEAKNMTITPGNLQESDISNEIVARFGLGFQTQDYKTLQAEYDSWVEHEGEPVDKRQEELYVSICYMKLNYQKFLQSGAQGIGSLSKEYRSSIEAATTEIEDRRRKAEQEHEKNPIGVYLKEIEHIAPGEFFKDKKLYKDYDSIGEYFRRILVRPIKNLLTGSKELDKEFSLSDGEERG